MKVKKKSHIQVKKLLTVTNPVGKKLGSAEKQYLAVFLQPVDKNKVFGFRFPHIWKGTETEAGPCADK